MKFGGEYSDPGPRPNSDRAGAVFSMKLQKAVAFTEEGAQEEKFLLPLDGAGPVRDWAMANLSPDPHGRGPSGAYAVQSLYLDTPQLASYRRTPKQPVARYRIRRYGDEAVVHLERKVRCEGHVRKQRTTATAEQIRWLNGETPPLGWDGWWFKDECVTLDLRPVCTVSYLRCAWTGEVDNVHLRVTLDQAITASPQVRLIAPQVGDSGCPLWEGVVLEVKSESVMPASLRQLVDSLTAIPGRLSKYCRAVDRCGLNRAPGPGSS